MIAALAKAASVGIIAYCAVGSTGRLSEQVNKLVSLPKRVMTVNELKQIHRLIQYELVDGSSRTIRLDEFCRKELDARGRDPGQDYWKTPYRLYCRGTLHGEGSSVSMIYDDLDHYVAVSAGADRQFMTKDDLTSRSDANEEVQKLMKQIDAEVKKAREAEKRKQS